MIDGAVNDLYHLLVQEKFLDVEALTSGNRLSAPEIANAIAQHGRTLVPYPADRILDVIEIRDSSPKSWSIVAPVYTREEGLSDLSIELTISEGNPTPKIELDGIHVL